MSPTDRIQLSVMDARRLAVAAQGLDAPRPEPDKAALLDLFRRINCVQIDPIRAVERTQLLVIWSRLGPFDPTLLDELQTDDRDIFEAWAHAASLVLTEDYPLFAHWMQGEDHSEGEWGQRVRSWLEANTDLHQHVMHRLAEDGPLATGEFDDVAAVPWESTGWSSGRNVTRMLDFLYGRGKVLSVGRRGNQKLWHLLEQWLPEWADHDPWEEAEVVRQTIHRSLRALGVATARQIKNHFIRNKYPKLNRRIAELVAQGNVLPAQIIGEDDTPWPDDWFIHKDLLPRLRAIQAGKWRPRTVLLSPFDNLICDRSRTEQLFNFQYRIEIYVPKAKRQYGYYVLPILHGDRLIGRMDSKLDRKSGIYHIHAIYAEQENDVSEATGAALAETLTELALFIGAQRLALSEGTMPHAWRTAIEERWQAVHSHPS